MTISHLRSQLWSLRKEVRASVPLSTDGLVMLVIELIALKIGMGAEWSKFVKSQDGVMMLFDKAMQLETSHKISALELRRATGFKEAPGWLRELMLFTDGLETQATNRKELALLLMELLSDSRNEIFNLTAGLSRFLSIMIDGYQDDGVLGMGAGMLDPVLRAKHASERVVLTEMAGDLTKLLAFIADEDIQVYTGSPFYGESLLELRDRGVYSTVLTDMPWNVKKIKGRDNWSYISRFDVEPTTSESLYIQTAMQVSDDKVLAIVPQSFLYKTAGSDQALKRLLVNDGSIHAVIQLPRVMSNTIVAPALLIMSNRNPAGKVYMADFSQTGAFGAKGGEVADESELTRLAMMVYEQTDTSNTTKVMMPEIEENDYNLSVSRYLVSSIHSQFKHIFTSEKITQLRDVAEIRRAQSIKTVDRDKYEGIVNELCEIMPADIGLDGYIESPGKVLFVPQQNLRRVDKQRVQPGDILLTIKGNVGKVGRVPQDCGDNWVAGQSFVILREVPGTGILEWSSFIYRYLTSALAKTLLNSRVVGAGVKMIKMQDLEELAVVIPDVEEQKKMIEKEREIGLLYTELAGIMARIEEKENSFFACDINDYLDSRDME